MCDVKKCQICGRRATMFLTQIVNGQATDLVLCENCAKEKGLFDPQTLTFAEKFFPEEFKARVDKIVRELSEKKEEESSTLSPQSADCDLLTQCPVCHFTLDQHRATGHMGCPACYDVFARELNPDSMENSENSPAEGHTASPSLLQLKKQLQYAVEQEDYEEAAKLRDLINSLSGKQG